jgi:hypothetical protein
MIGQRPENKINDRAETRQHANDRPDTRKREYHLSLSETKTKNEKDSSEN